MYQALYRKYRSQTFGEMVGQKSDFNHAQTGGRVREKSAMPISFLGHVVPVKPVQQKSLPRL